VRKKGENSVGDFSASEAYGEAAKRNNEENERKRGD